MYVVPIDRFPHWFKETLNLPLKKVLWNSLVLKTLRPVLVATMKQPLSWLKVTEWISSDVSSIKLIISTL